jgi:hypothetical protein
MHRLNLDDQGMRHNARMRTDQQRLPKLADLRLGNGLQDDLHCRLRLHLRQLLRVWNVHAQARERRQLHHLQSMSKWEYLRGRCLLQLRLRHSLPLVFGQQDWRFERHMRRDEGRPDLWERKRSVLQRRSLHQRVLDWRSFLRQRRSQPNQRVSELPACRFEYWLDHQPKRGSLRRRRSLQRRHLPGRMLDWRVIYCERLG